MALGNWDSYEVDLDNKPIGTFTTPLGISAEIYKNWIYISDKIAWRSGSYVSPTIMEVKEGQLTYLDLHIHAVRGPENGVYVAMMSADKGLVGYGIYDPFGERHEEAKGFLIDFVKQVKEESNLYNFPSTFKLS